MEAPSYLNISLQLYNSAFISYIPMEAIPNPIEEMIRHLLPCQ